VLLGEDLRGRIRQIGRLEKNPQRLLIWYQDFRSRGCPYALKLIDMCYGFGSILFSIDFCWHEIRALWVVIESLID